MKSKGYHCDFIAERNADILRAYRNIIAARDNISLTEVAQQIAASPSKRFWVSEERAYNAVCWLLRGDSLDYMIPSRRQMFLEIFRRYKIYCRRFPSLAKKDIIFRICNEQAPCFYLTPKSVVVILHKARKEEKRRCYEQRKRRLQLTPDTLS